MIVEIILMVGGSYLCYEGAHKIQHRFVRHDDETRLPSVAIDEDRGEDDRQRIRTDFILSGEITVIYLKEVIDEGFVSRAVILLVVAVLITAAGVWRGRTDCEVDDVGLRMVDSGRPLARIGRGMITGMPTLLALLSTVGTAAIVWVEDTS